MSKSCEVFNLNITKDSTGHFRTAPAMVVDIESISIPAKKLKDITGNFIDKFDQFFKTGNDSAGYSDKWAYSEQKDGSHKWLSVAPDFEIEVYRSSIGVYSIHKTFKNNERVCAKNSFIILNGLIIYGQTVTVIKEKPLQFDPPAQINNSTAVSALEKIYTTITQI